MKAQLLSLGRIMSVPLVITVLWTGGSLVAANLVAKAHPRHEVIAHTTAGTAAVNDSASPARLGPLLGQRLLTRTEKSRMSTGQ
jgi:hypothetical protein